MRGMGQVISLVDANYRFPVNLHTDTDTTTKIFIISQDKLKCGPLRDLLFWADIEMGHLEIVYSNIPRFKNLTMGVSFKKVGISCLFVPSHGVCLSHFQAHHTQGSLAGRCLQPDHVLLSQRSPKEQTLRQLCGRGRVRGCLSWCMCQQFDLAYCPYLKYTRVLRVLSFGLNLLAVHLIFAVWTTVDPLGSSSSWCPESSSTLTMACLNTRPMTLTLSR